MLAATTCYCTYPVPDDDDGHDTGHVEWAPDEYGVHVDHGERAAPGDQQAHDRNQEAAMFCAEFRTNDRVQHIFMFFITYFPYF